MPRDGVKLSIRTDQAASVVRAYFATLDDTERYEVATLDLGLANQVPNLVEQWCGLLALALAYTLDAVTGEKVSGFEVLRPHEMN